MKEKTLSNLRQEMFDLRVASYYFLSEEEKRIIGEYLLADSRLYYLDESDALEDVLAALCSAIQHARNQLGQNGSGEKGVIIGILTD